MSHLRMLVIITIMFLQSGVVFAQGEGNYPNRFVRLIVGSSDALPRVLAQGLTRRLGQQVVVDTRGAGVIAIESLVNAPPDGYTLLLYGNTMWLGPLMQRATYDPVKDLAPVSLVTTAPAVMAVHPALPVKSVKDLIALAKARPGQLNYGSGGAGGTPHLGAELFKSMAGVNIVRVPYKGTIQAAVAAMTGEVQLVFATTGAIGPHVKSGRLRALGVTSPRRTALVPDLPAVAEALPGYEMTQVQGVFAPARTPAQIIGRLQQEIARIVDQAEVKEQFQSLGTEAVGSSPEALAQAIKSEIERLGKVIREANIRGE